MKKPRQLLYLLPFLALGAYLGGHLLAPDTPQYLGSNAAHHADANVGSGSTDLLAGQGTGEAESLRSQRELRSKDSIRVGSNLTAIRVPDGDRQDFPEADGRLITTNQHIRKPLDKTIPLDKNHPQIKEVLELKDRHLPIMADPSVKAMAVGLNDEGELAIVIYTNDMKGAYPGVIEGVPVILRESDDIAAGKKRGQGNAKANRPIPIQAGETSYSESYERPVPIGISTGHPAITAGTLGCRVTDGSNLYALSNNHVYANSNNSNIGDAVIQPGSFDGGSSPSDDIGTLNDFESIVFGGSPRRSRNVMDAAIALVTAGDVGNSTPAIGGYGTPSSTTNSASLGMAVEKVGRTTGYTFGSVTAIGANVRISYDGGLANFRDQIIIAPGSFSAGGDSGSLIVSSSGKNPVGLLYAGSDTQTIANDIEVVLSRFDVAVDDSNPVPINSSPTATITRPADSSTHASGASISFSGFAGDAEDGDLTAFLTWTSSVDDVIGTGGIFSAPLTDGEHTITVSVTDSGGASGGDSISITVGSPNTPPTVTISTPTHGSSYSSGANIPFAASANDSEDGDLGASMTWTSSIDGDIGMGGSLSAVLSDGEHTITASATDSGGAGDNDSVSISVGSPATATTVSVVSISSATEGGRQGDKHLIVSVALEDSLGNPVSGADVSVSVDNTTTGASAGGLATTGTGGVASFNLKNAPSGVYTTTVTGVEAAGLTWDGNTPDNEFPK